jgi:tetratricopeptide (TPR) repeat protein
VHPIHTEAVDWIAALPDVLVTTWALLGLRALAMQESASTAGQAVMHSAIYFAALLTKETGVMLLPLYMAYGWLFSKRRNAALYAGMTIALAVYLAMRVHALGGLAPAQQAFFHLSATQFGMSAALLAARYLLALLWPVNLNFFHVFHPAGASFEVLLALLALGAVVWAAFRSRRGAPLAAFAMFWIAAAIAPALNISGVGQNVFAERYLYLPSVGFELLVGLAWTWLASAYPAWPAPAAAAILTVFAVESMVRNRDWKDDFTLLQVTLRQSPDSGYLHNLMAGAWVQRDQFQRALEEQKLAVRYEPGSAVFHKNLGNILLGMDPRAAAREFTAALAIQPGSAELHGDLGLAYKAMGEPAKAAEEFRRAVQ